MGLFSEKRYWILCWGGRKKRSFTLLVVLGFIFCLLYLAVSTFTAETLNSYSRLKHQQSYLDKSSVRVVVGHYVGGISAANLTDEMINKNNYNPVAGAGDGGRPVQLLSREVIHARDLFSLHGFNIIVSDRVPLNRSLPDMRSQRYYHGWCSDELASLIPPAPIHLRHTCRTRSEHPNVVDTRLMRTLDIVPVSYGENMERSSGECVSYYLITWGSSKGVCIDRKISVDSLPTASVIIVFHNEAWSTLMRTVTSVILRSPKQLLKEIILVDDASERKYLGAELEEAVAKLTATRVLRSPARAGLVAARLIGARNASGDALVFLDAHCEVTTGWLEPLLDQAASDDIFVCPHIDLLSDDTLAYVRSTDAHWGAFSRRLHFRWLAPSNQVLEERMKDPSKPYPTPAMAGGLFAVRKSLFWRLGGYDEGMKVWGGENLELSWRAWQCGARVEIAPCSRVGHIFRKHSPYSFPGGVASILHTNLARAAIVWMDEFADFFFKFNPSVAEKREQQDVRERIELRKRLNCKSFQWYLQHVWPQHFFPAKDRWFGRIRSAKGACLGTANIGGTPGLGGVASGVNCGGDWDLDGLLVFTQDGQIMADEGLCLEAATGRVVWRACSGNDKQRWQQKGPRLKDRGGDCLTLASGESGADGVSSPLLTRKCVASEEQVWKFERVAWR